MHHFKFFTLLNSPISHFLTSHFPILFPLSPSPLPFVATAIVTDLCRRCSRHRSSPPLFSSPIFRLDSEYILELLHAAYNVIYTLNEEEIRRSGIQSATLLAARRGNSEFIVDAIKVHFPLVWTVDPEEGRSLFFLSIQFRQAKFFNLIHEFARKHVFAN